MKKLIIAFAVLVGVGYLARRFAPTHDNTERILELLEDRAGGGSEPPEAVEGNAT